MNTSSNTFDSTLFQTESDPEHITDVTQEDAYSSEDLYASEDLYTSEDLYATDEEADSASDDETSGRGPLDENLFVPDPEDSLVHDDLVYLNNDDMDGELTHDSAKTCTHHQRKVVLVTGAAGFIGSAAAEALLSRGDTVIGVDEMNDYYDVRRKEANVQRLRHYPEFTFYCGDVCDADMMEGIFASHQPRWVLHLAARAGVRPSIDNPMVYVHSNVEATTKLLELARQNEVANFVFASSSSVYGGSQRSVFRETDAVDAPVSPYAATKKACELLGHTWHHLYGLNVTGLRFFTVYGPNGRPDMAPYKFVDRIFRGAELQQYGDGSSSRDYTYIDDIVDGTLRALDRPLGYQIFNLGRGGKNPVLLRDFISIVERLVGKAANVQVFPDQPGDVPRTCADISKAQQLLGYEPKVDFEEGMRRTVQWYESSVAPTL